MKTLLIIRHAEAAPSSGGGGDHARKLTPKGEADASSIATQLSAKRLMLQYFVSSDALRAQMTADIIARGLGLTRGDVMSSAMLYSATVPDWLKVIHDLPGWCECAALVGHNPSIAELRARLIGPHAMPTPPGAAAILHFDEDDWRAVEHAIPQHSELLRP